MATRSKKANESNDVTSTGAAAATEALKKFSKEVFEGATKEAISALQSAEGTVEEIKKLENEIGIKKEGIAGLLLRLAKKCVELTMDGKTARLKLAADLMRDACNFAEDARLTAYRKAHNGAETIIRNIVPSWPVLKSEFLNAMEKAQIDPTPFGMPAQYRKGYSEWKEKNPDAKDSRGAKKRETEAGNVVRLDVPKVAAETATKMAKLSDSARSALAALTSAIQNKPEALQRKAAEMIEDLIKEINALEEEAPPKRVPPRPARESERGAAVA